MPAKNKQLGLFTEPKKSKPRAPKRLPRSAADSDPRWIFSFVAPTPDEYARLVEADANEGAAYV